MNENEKTDYKQELRNIYRDLFTQYVEYRTVNFNKIAICKNLIELEAENSIWKKLAEKYLNIITINQKKEAICIFESLNLPIPDCLKIEKE